MKYIANMWLYRYGVRFCEQKFLPYLVRRLEPLQAESKKLPALREVDPLVTEYELKETLEKYQFADKYLKLGLIAILTLIAGGVSLLIRVVPNSIVVLLLIVCELSALVLLLGAYMRFRSRWKEWQEIWQREILVEKIEYYAKVTSSTIIAQIIVEIEKIKETQKQEAEKAKAYSAIQTGTMKTFLEMLDERERTNRGKERSKAIVAFFVGYFAGKGLDALLGIKIGSLHN